MEISEKCLCIIPPFGTAAVLNSYKTTSAKIITHAHVNAWLLHANPIVNYGSNMLLLKRYFPVLRVMAE